MCGVSGKDPLLRSCSSGVQRSSGGRLLFRPSGDRPEFPRSEHTGRAALCEPLEVKRRPRALPRGNPPSEIIRSPATTTGSRVAPGFLFPGTSAFAHFGLSINSAGGFGEARFDTSPFPTPEASVSERLPTPWERSGPSRRRRVRRSLSCIRCLRAVRSRLCGNRPRTAGGAGRRPRRVRAVCATKSR